VAAVFDGMGANGVFTVVTLLVFVVPTLSVSVRRLHDIDMRGWWLLLSLTGVGNILLVIWWCIRGTGGPNRFGPDPLADKA
jgi:uncharacterized membrane protein YhaH (DUF805 family)